MDVVLDFNRRLVTASGPYPLNPIEFVSDQAEMEYIDCE